MNKLKILKSNISSTAILAFAMFLCLLCSLLLLPIGINYKIGNENTDNLEFYSEEIADYCVIDFPSEYYKDLCKTFDMENFVGTAYVGYYLEPIGDYFNQYSLEVVSEKMAKQLSSLGYNFLEQQPADCKVAYAPTNLKGKYKIGDFVNVSCYKGVFEYKQKLKIIGFNDKGRYEFSFYDAKTDRSDPNTFLIFDEIPPYAIVRNGLMLSDKSAEHYKSLGAKARTIRELNESQKYSYSDDSVLYWSSCLLILLAIAIATNYYFSVDKTAKRSGIMTIYGAKRSDIVAIELIKLILIYAVTVILSVIFTSIMIIATNDTISWLAYFIGLGISTAVYIVSVSFGFIKFARFEPLKALARNNVE